MCSSLNFALSVIGFAQNTYVGIKKHKGSTKGLISLSIPEILIIDEPNEVHVRVDQGEFKFL